ncbi:MAG TPA: hypothetical protein VJM33_16185 [Microthrixaceae bacterium]|nr:hypothetical protein [Microthrixaceae bacterium]
MSLSYLQRHGLAEVEPGRVVRLTGAGGRARGPRHRVAQTNDAALREVLDAIVSHDAFAVGLVPPDGCWRGERPYLAQRKCLVADPTSALPWQPMVLHRGGWARWLVTLDAEVHEGGDVHAAGGRLTAGP